jgi:hypothetical protein
MPSGYQIQEGLRTVETLSYTVPQMVETAQDLKGMVGSRNQGGRPGPYNDEDDYTPSPGGDNPGGRRLGPGRGCGRGRDDGYTPSPGGDYNPSDDDYTPSPDGRGPKRFDQWPTKNNSRPSAPRDGWGARGGGRNDDYTPSPGGYSDDYTPSPGGSDYSPREDDFTPSPDGSGPKHFPKWPTNNNPNSSASANGRGPYLGTPGSRNGPGPLGPSGSNQPPKTRAQSIPRTYEFPFEKCQHRMKYINGPSGSGPYNYTGNPARWLKPSPVAFEGFCLTCDTAFRRQKEQEQLDNYETSYQAELRYWKEQNQREPSAQEQREIRGGQRVARDGKIKQIWGNWNQRWKSPMVVEFGEDGRALMKKSAV